MTLLRLAWSRAVDAVFPPRCFGCRAYGRFLCDECLASAAPATSDPHPTLSGDARSAFAYGDAVRNALLALKFEGVSAAAPEIAARMSSVLTVWSPAVDVIVPVPLGWVRRRTRGYNQSELLAKEIARTARLPIEVRSLRRKRQTRPQTLQPDAESRRRNVRDAFAIGSRPVTGSVLLIDDVTTTGATLEACATALRDGGATRVYALTFAREA